jgi:CelD/BcsL family acetyltransferase involved in cellulose biosynthesis
MRIELHQDATEELAREWQELYAADPRATPFVSPAWVLSCWRHYGADARPWLLAARDQGRLVGLAPLAIRRRRGIRTLHVLAEQLADYWDVLALPAARAQVLDTLARELRRRAGEWDELSLTRLPPGSPSAGALARAGARVHSGTGLPSPGVELPAAFEDYLRMLPSSHRSNLRRHLRRLDERELELHTVSDRDQLGQAVDRWHELRLRQWSDQQRRLHPLQVTDRFKAFIQDVLHELVPARRALLWEFRAGERLVGSYVNLVDERAFYWYLGGYEPDAASLGVGKIAVAEGIRSSIDAGRSYFDFMIGAEPYKYWYGAGDRFVDRLTLGSPRPRSLLLLGLRRARARIR